VYRSRIAGTLPPGVPQHAAQAARDTLGGAVAAAGRLPGRAGRVRKSQGDAFDRAIADFSCAYADQNEMDYQAFAAAVKSGRLTAQTGL
jgi:Uncharacterized protein conserved in bacteria (DUF2252)